MESESFQKETFDQVDYSENRMEGEAYEQCLFSNCNFFNSDLCRIEFMDCQFINCNFSMTSIIDAAFKNVAFQQCKLMGIDFSKCDDFLFSASFSNADLSFAIFDTCNLLQATFYNSILEKADFRTAINYSFDPAYNKIKKAKFSLEGLPGLLSKYNIEVNY